MRAFLVLVALTAVPGTQADAGSTIAKRLETANYTIVSFKTERGPKATTAFHVTADYTTRHAFWFYVFVYPTHAIAEAAETQECAWLDKYGSPGASQLEVDGRVFYFGATGPVYNNEGGNPSLPLARFQRMVALARG